MNTTAGSQPGLGGPKNHYNKKAPPLFFIMMRFNKKVALCFFGIMVMFITLSLWSRCGDGISKEWAKNHRYPFNKDSRGVSSLDIEDIDCIINNDRTIGCRKEGDEVYVPFSLIHKYFEVYGKLAVIDGVERFEWSHSYSRIYQPKGKYDPRGVFMHFENYNVEGRDRVKCVSAIDGVPISMQWESQGYYYPTQIAQFGLSHYSKNLTDPEPRSKLVENADKELAKWTVPSDSKISRIIDGFTNVLNFTAGDRGISLKMDHVLDFVMTVNLALTVNSSFTVILQNREKMEQYNLHYIASDILLSAQENNIYHGLGVVDSWTRITRDLIIDLQKGLSFVEKVKPKIPRSKIKVIGFILHGRGSLDNLTLASSEHILQFYDAAEWFIRHQDPETGGWPIPVKRKLAPGFLDLEPGWLSSMGQGQAVSVLARAYHHSGGQLRYLESALAGLKPFRVPSWQGGVLATFLNKYHWYEEYPTKPASFVLNGFIYSLLGLYDLMIIAPTTQAREAEVLFDEGMASLKRMLTLFDMGSTTAYDLRHFTLGIAPNLARWDYHAAHVNQLLLLSSIDSDEIFKQTAERWIGYMSGKRAAHN